MACQLQVGYAEGCKDQIGGIDAFYVIAFGDMGTITVDPATDEISDADGTFTAYKYEVKTDDTNLSNPFASSTTAGTTVFTQTLNVALKKITATMNKELRTLALGRFHIVAADRNGNAFLMGVERGAEADSGNVMTGGATTDRSGYDIVFTAQERYPANIISGATAVDPFAGLISATATIQEAV